MKKKVNKDIYLFVVLIVTFLGIAFFISTSMDSKLPSYSVVNKSKMGLSIFYESLKEFKYPVERTIKPIKLQPVNSTQIVVRTATFDVNSDEIQNWVGQGGILVYLSQDDINFVDYGQPTINKNKTILYKYNQGIVIVANADYLTNKTLLENTDNAYEILEEISNYTKGNIYFNEENIYSSINKNNLWNYIPKEIKFILYQLLMVLIGFFYYKGKRFGKIVAFHEEHEREENEYVYSVASIYRRGNCWDIILENYYNKFLSMLKGSGENWIQYWEIENLPQLGKAKKVYDFMEFKKINITKIKANEYAEVINTIEMLMKILNKRRDVNWKTLKKIT